MPNTIAGIFREYGAGQLHSGSKTGPVVKSRKQATAIALNAGTDAPKRKAKSTYAHPLGNLKHYAHDKRNG